MVGIALLWSGMEVKPIFGALAATFAPVAPPFDADAEAAEPPINVSAAPARLPTISLRRDIYVFKTSSNARLSE